MPQIEMQHVTKYFTNEQRRFTAIDDVSLTIERGSLFSLLAAVEQEKPHCFDCWPIRLWRMKGKSGLMMSN